MNVQDLIDMLSLIEDKSATVYIDGCDCTEDASAVFDEGDRVAISRPDAERHHQEADRVGSEVAR